jgi:hypothetical protein
MRLLTVEIMEKIMRGKADAICGGGACVPAAGAGANCFIAQIFHLYVFDALLYHQRTPT